MSSACRWYGRHDHELHTRLLSRTCELI
jgi:hypothetical protein